MAPESVADPIQQHVKNDVWFLGMFAYALATNELPYSDVTDSSHAKLASVNREPPRLPELEEWTNQFRDFVACCLKK